MPMLPGIEVTDAQLARVSNSFPGATNAEKAANYRKFVISKLIEYVIEVELGEFEAILTAERQAAEDVIQKRRLDKEKAIRDSLPAAGP